MTRTQTTAIANTTRPIRGQIVLGVVGQRDSRIRSATEEKAVGLVEREAPAMIWSGGDGDENVHCELPLLVGSHVQFPIKLPETHSMIGAS